MTNPGTLRVAFLVQMILTDQTRQGELDSGGLRPPLPQQRPDTRAASCRIQAPG